MSLFYIIFPEHLLSVFPEHCSPAGHFSLHLSTQISLLPSV